jgi:DNA-binding GntR family transcriptional regulator
MPHSLAVSRVSGIAERVRLQILAGGFPAGGRLVELHLAERLDVPRPALREALRRLEGEGLLASDEAGGMRVVDIGPGELAETLQVRAELEALAAGLAAGRVAAGTVDPAMLARLERLSAAAARAPRTGAVLADAHLHRAVAALAGNRPCRDALDRCWDRIVLAAAHDVPGARRVAADGHEHAPLIAAIAAGDADGAASLARRHAGAGATAGPRRAVAA